MASNFVLSSPDLLYLIFEDCVPECKFPEISLSNTPLILTHVNSCWREVAVNYGRLWPGFGLVCKERDLDAALEEGTGNAFPALLEWLKRSGQHPFTLKVTCNTTLPTFRGTPKCHCV